MVSSCHPILPWQKFRLEAVRVSVTQDTGGLRPGQTCSLVRWVRDPSYQPGAATTDQTAPPATTPVQPGGTP